MELKLLDGGTFSLVSVAFVVGGTWAAGTSQVHVWPPHTDWVLDSYTEAGLDLKAVPRRSRGTWMARCRNGSFAPGAALQRSWQARGASVVAEAAPSGSLFRYGWRRLQVAGSTAQCWSDGRIEAPEQ